jgi:branched-chain amino acid transport system substrate-binding protein
MKRFVTKVFAVVLAVVFVMSFAACSGSGKKAEAATIKVGVLAPLTGAVAEYGNAVNNGVVMYFEELNAKGGINGKQVELVTYDEEGDPVKAVTGYNSLVDQGVVAIVGDVTTAPTVAVVAESQADNMPMITASATAETVTCQLDADGKVVKVYENMFRSCFIDPFQGSKMAAFAQDKLGAKTAAVLYNVGSDYSAGCAASFQETAKEVGLEVVAVESYADGAVDFQSQLTNIAAKAPDVLFVPDYYGVIVNMAKQAFDAGVKATMLGADGWDSVAAKIDDPQLLNGFYYCSGYSKDDTREAVQTFVKNFETKYSSTPDMFAAQGYDAAMIMAAAIEKAEASGKKAGSDEYKAAVIAALKATNMDCVTGHVQFNEYNNPEKSAAIITFENGEAKYWGNY